MALRPGEQRRHRDEDEDFANQVTAVTEAPPVIWIRVGNTRRAALLSWFEPHIEGVVEMISAGDRLVELR